MFLFLLNSFLCFLGVTKVDKPAGRPAVICNLIPGFEHALTTGPIRGLFYAICFLPAAQRVQPAFGVCFWLGNGRCPFPILFLAGKRKARPGAAAGRTTAAVPVQVTRSCINLAAVLLAACCVLRALLRLHLLGSLVYHCVHLRSLSSLTPWPCAVCPSSSAALCLVAAPFGSALIFYFVPWFIASAFIVVFRSSVATRPPFNSSLCFSETTRLTWCLAFRNPPPPCVPP